MGDDNDDSFKLSRRKALAGMGSIGLAGALGVGGTYAQFTDTEDTTVQFTAGGIDGALSYNASYNSQMIGDGSVTHVQTNDDGVACDVEFTDVKPGDYGCFNFGLTVTNNPAWVAACVEIISDTDGKTYEPEVDVDPDLEEADIGTDVSSPLPVSTQFADDEITLWKEGGTVCLSVPGGTTSFLEDDDGLANHAEIFLANDGDDDWDLQVRYSSTTDANVEYSGWSHQYNGDSWQDGLPAGYSGNITSTDGYDVMCVTPDEDISAVGGVHTSVEGDADSENKGYITDENKPWDANGLIPCPTGAGELDTNTYILPYYDSDGTCVFFDPDGDPEFDPQESSVSTPSAFWSNSQDGDAPDVGFAVQPDDGEEYYLAPRTIRNVADGVSSIDTAHWNHESSEFSVENAPGGTDVSNGCVLLDGSEADGGDTGNNTQGVSPLQPGSDALNFGWDWHIPFETGNIAQGDTLKLRISFLFLQTRHTEAPNFGTYAPGQNVP